MQNREECIRKLGDLISDIRVAMLTTFSRDGHFHGRPMWTQKTPFDGDLWFFTAEHSPKSLEINRDHHVSLSYCDPDDNRYVAVTGRAEIVHDRAMAEKLWSPMHRAWFPKGLDDPELALLRVRVERAEYWDSPSSRMVQLLGFVKATATGEPYRPGPDGHQKVDLAG